MSMALDFELGKKMMRELHAVLDGIPCFLVMGTCLGAYRIIERVGNLR